MKISVSTYSFDQYLRTGQMTQLDCIQKAKELGFEGVEFVDILPPEGVSKEEYAQILRAECEKLGMAVSNFTFSADFLNGCNGDTAAEIERVKKQIDLAKTLGAVSVRHDTTIGYQKNIHPFESFDAVLPVLADACREVTEYAAALGIKTMTENHGYFSQDSDRVERLVTAVNHSNFGLLTDMGNFLCADERPEVAVGRTAPYAFYAHAKDFYVKDGNGMNPGEGYFRSRGGAYLKGAIIGHGDVPVYQCLQILKNAGFDGWLAIEFEGMEDALTGIRIGLNNLKKYLSFLE